MLATNRLIPLIQSHRLRFSRETDLHADLKTLLVTAGIFFVHELRLTEKDRIDFYLPDSMIGIECKVDGGPTAVASQLLRYAQHEDIAELILITSRRGQVLTVDNLSGKPLHCIWIGGSSL